MSPCFSVYHGLTPPVSLSVSPSLGLTVWIRNVSVFLYVSRLNAPVSLSMSPRLRLTVLTRNVSVFLYVSRLNAPCLTVRVARYRRGQQRCCCPVLCAPCAEICCCGADVNRSDTQAGWSDLDQHQLRASFDRGQPNGISYSHDGFQGNGQAPVSYTHLTLPTSDLV